MWISSESGVTARAGEAGVGGPVKGSGGAAEIPGPVGTECRLIPRGHRRGSGVFPEREGKSLGHFDRGVTQPGCCGGHRMQAGHRWGHGSVRGSCRPRGEGGLGEDCLSR